MEIREKTELRIQVRALGACGLAAVDDLGFALAPAGNANVWLIFYFYPSGVME